MLQMEHVYVKLKPFIIFVIPFQRKKKKKTLSFCMLKVYIYIYTEINVCECDLYKNNEDLLIGNGLLIKTMVNNNTQ